MIMLLTTVAFGSASCAYILHELQKAPLGIETGGKFYLCERTPRVSYRTAPHAALASGCVGT